jgi:hypothetical protein
MMTAAVERWEQLLGLPPTFVDGDRWAQFDVGGRGSLWRAPTGPPNPQVDDQNRTFRHVARVAE